MTWLLASPCDSGDNAHVDSFEQNRFLSPVRPAPEWRRRWRVPSRTPRPCPARHSAQRWEARKCTHSRSPARSFVLAFSEADASKPQHLLLFFWVPCSNGISCPASISPPPLCHGCALLLLVVSPKDQGAVVGDAIEWGYAAPSSGSHCNSGLRHDVRLIWASTRSTRHHLFGGNQGVSVPLRQLSSLELQTSPALDDSPVPCLRGRSPEAEQLRLH